MGLDARTRKSVGHAGIPAANHIPLRPQYPTFFNHFPSQPSRPADPYLLPLGMSTEKQIAANHRNAQSSTGPRTPEGKARSSLNAVKHGLTAAQILIPSESADEFESHAASFRDRFAPVDSVESFLVDQMIVAAWRLRRTRFLESKIYAQRAFEVDRHQKEREEELTDAADHIVTGYRRECSGTNSLENISRQETRIERAFYRALHEFNRLRNPKGKTPTEPVLQNEPNFPSSAGDLVIVEPPNQVRITARTLAGAVDGSY